MKHIKTFEMEYHSDYSKPETFIGGNGKVNYNGRYYWLVENEPFYFRKALEKIHCPNNTIDYFVSELHRGYNYINEPYMDDELYISTISDRWSSSWALDSKSSKNIEHLKKEYKYQGKIELTPEEMKEVEFQRNVNKYNL